MTEDKTNETPPAESLTGGQLDETAGESDTEMVSMSREEFDKAISDAGKEAVAKASNENRKSSQPNAVTTSDIAEREKAQDEARGNKKLQNNSKEFRAERAEKAKRAKTKADKKAEQKKAKRKAAKK